MGTHHSDGYSASVSGFLIVDGTEYRLAKTGGGRMVLVEPQSFPAGTLGELRITVDGDTQVSAVELLCGEGHAVRYRRR